MMDHGYVEKEGYRDLCDDIKDNMAEWQAECVCLIQLINLFSYTYEKLDIMLIRQVVSIQNIKILL